MTGSDLILEIGTEEIPARFMPGALRQLKEETQELLRSSRLEFNEVKTWGTPRRLLLYVTDLAPVQEERLEKKKGPSKDASFDKDGNPTKAALGFAEKQGLSVDKLELERSGDKEYLVAVQKIPGEKTPLVLQELLPGLIRSIVFPKNMVWEEGRLRFPRPIRWILCLFGEEPVQFSYAGVAAGNVTRGRRFFTPGPFVIKNPEHYFSCLKEAGVILDHEERESQIRSMVEEAARSFGGVACLDEDLVTEVTFLVESPAALLCSYPESYLDLPREVLVTTMQSHQRYFPVEDAAGAIRPYFVVVSNNGAETSEHVRRGNEKVLKARLADARFFYDEDRKISLETRMEELKSILFQEELGTLWEKTMRLHDLAGFLLEMVADPGALAEGEKEASLRAALLAKADLATHMVGEFPELQGIMGREYALREGESEKTAVAIYEHYLPRFAGDVLPATTGGVVLALADKVDQLAGCFAVGIRPSGSQDPYALRRQALGILHILLSRELSISFEGLVRQALLLLQKKLSHLGEDDLSGILAEFRQFAWQRLRFFLQEEGLDYDIIEGVLNIPLDNIVSLAERARFLQGVRESDEIKDAAAGYIRVANLARQASSSVMFMENILREEGEKQLYASLLEADNKVSAALGKKDYADVLKIMADLKASIDVFFAEVLVMVEDQDVRENRLSLLKMVCDFYQQMADFSRIVFPAK